MADLVTHLASALIPGVGLPPRVAAVLAIGVALPDLGGRLPAIAVGLLPWELPASLTSPFDVLHQPIGAAAACVAIGTLFVEGQRRLVTGWLLGGVALHLAVDLLQDHHGQGYFLGFPFSTGRFELGWIGSEATTPWAPWLALATAAVWGVRAALTRRRAGPRVDGAG